MLIPPEHCCANCLFWKEGGPQIAAAARDPSCPAGVGTCHVNPPFVVPMQPFPVTMWPRTHATGFCAEFIQPVGNPTDPGDGEAVPEHTVIPLRRAA